MIDTKINQLLELSDEFLFIEYYTHTNCKMYKIKNIYTKYKEEKIVLSPVSEGIEKALNLAIEQITLFKEKYYENVQNN